MAALTNFLKLLKPEKNDYVDVDKHISENYDKIDSKMQELNTSNSGKLDKGAVSTEYDTAKKIEDKIKAAQGTADNKLNKGSLPATVPDGKAIYDLLENNGGINIDPNLLYLNDVGTKTAGKLYLDRNKKGLFECVQTTTATTNSTTYFVDISNKASADRLANLVNYKFESKKCNFGGTINFYKYGNIGIISIEEVAFKNTQLVCSLPTWFDPKHSVFFAGCNAIQPIEITINNNGIIGFGEVTGISASAAVILN